MWRMPPLALAAHAQPAAALALAAAAALVPLAVQGQSFRWKLRYYCGIWGRSPSRLPH